MGARTILTPLHAFAATLFLAVVACGHGLSQATGSDGGSTANGSSSGGTGSSSGSSSGGTSYVPPDGSVTTPGPPNYCGSVPAGWHNFSAESEVLPYIERTWLACNGGVLGIANQAGLELGTDGTFRILVDASGALVPSTDPNGSGTYTVLAFRTSTSQGGSQFQITLQGATEQTFLGAMLLDSPPMMLVSPLSISVIAYVPQSDTDWPPVSVPQPSLGTAKPPPAACSADAGTGDGGADDGPGSGADAGAIIAGDWIYCSGPLPNLRTDFAGLRIDADGNFEALVWDATGALVPATDLFDSGAYYFSDTTGGAPTQNLFLAYGFIDSWGGPIDYTQFPSNLVFGGIVFVNRTLTGE